MDIPWTNRLVFIHHFKWNLIILLIVTWWSKEEFKVYRPKRKFVPNQSLKENCLMVRIRALLSSLVLWLCLVRIPYLTVHLCWYQPDFFRFDMQSGLNRCHNFAVIIPINCEIFMGLGTFRTVRPWAEKPDVRKQTEGISGFQMYLNMYIHQSELWKQIHLGHNRLTYWFDCFHLKMLCL